MSYFPNVKIYKMYIVSDSNPYEKYNKVKRYHHIVGLIEGNPYLLYLRCLLVEQIFIYGLCSP